MSNGDKEQARKDAKEKALESAPKTPNKFMIWKNRFKKSAEDTQPSLQGYYTASDRKIFKVSIWKNTSKAGGVYFSGSMDDLAVTQNVVEMPKPQPKKDNLDEDIPY